MKAERKTWSSRLQWYDSFKASSSRIVGLRSYLLLTVPDCSRTTCVYAFWRMHVTSRTIQSTPRRSKTIAYISPALLSDDLNLFADKDLHRSMMKSYYLLRKMTSSSSRRDMKMVGTMVNAKVERECFQQNWCVT